MKKNKVEYYKTYCTGCGLCKGANNVELEYTKSFIQPHLSEADISFCREHCPSAINLDYQNWNWEFWGHVEAAYLGYSGNPDIRYRASSGGAITAIASYLLKTGKVNGILHSVSDDVYPWRTKTVCTDNVEDLVKACGSRYAQSSPLADVFSMMKDGCKYAFIGKPCDVLALKEYCKKKENIRNKIYCTITFFCAGIPSEKANMELIQQLGYDDKTCKALSYRGNGWPGYAVAYGVDGTSNQIDYNSSWGKILGRDIRKMCRFCMVGTGEEADIACGDAWYLDSTGYPDFSEREGRNIILARTELAKTIINGAMENGDIVVSKYTGEPKLNLMNPFQYERKATQAEKVLAMKLFHKAVPNSNVKILGTFSNTVSVKRRWQVFKGTIGRIVRRKI